MLRDGVGRFGDLSTNLVVVTFSPTDTTQPTVTSFSPASAAINVNPNANVTVIFSEAMNEATVNTSTIELRDPSNATVPAVLSYNPATFTATLNPIELLTANTTYTVKVRGGSADPRVKDLAGNALAADVTWTFTAGSGGIKWLVTDHLGSTRMVVDESGSLAGITRHDYLPFGEEVAGVGIRNASNGYRGDSARQKFTGKERDDETSLDYFGARYYSSGQGRFVSVDQGEPELLDPQTWNRYQYTRNNPLYYIDPDGNNDKPAKNKYINDALATDPTLLEVIKASINFNQTVFENAFIRGGNNIRLNSGAGWNLVGLAAEAFILEGMRQLVPATTQPKFLKGTLPDIWFPIPGISTRAFELNGTFYNTVLDASGKIGDKQLSTDIKFGLAEVKVGKSVTTIREGANQVAATALALKLAGLPGVATLIIDKGAWDNL